MRLQTPRATCNPFSDIRGSGSRLTNDSTGLGGYIEASAEKLGLRSPNLTQLQEALPPVRRTRAMANIAGISIGCLLCVRVAMPDTQILRTHRMAFACVNRHGR